MERNNSLQWIKFTVRVIENEAFMKRKFSSMSSNTGIKPLKFPGNSICNPFCNTQCMWHSLEDLLDPWLLLVQTLPRKGNEMTQLEKWVKGKWSHISPLSSVLMLDLRGRSAPVCITHSKDIVPHADGNAMFMCSLPRLLLLLPPQKVVGNLGKEIFSYTDSP